MICRNVVIPTFLPDSFVNFELGLHIQFIGEKSSANLQCKHRYLKFFSGFFAHLDNKLTSYLATKSNREKTHRTGGHEIHVAHLCLTPAIIYSFYVRQIEHAQNGLKRGNKYTGGYFRSHLW